MNKVELNLVRSGDFRIEANSYVHNQPDNRKGNVDTLRGLKFEWTAPPDLSVLQYIVTFKRLDNGADTWPFKEEANGQGTAGSGYKGPLVITPGNVIKLTTKRSDPPVKYDVTAVPAGGSTIDSLDPMIIIRPGRSAMLAVGLACATAGFIVGFLVAMD